MGPQAAGMQPARVPLPLSLPEDGPIYVNAKQYHGILRRRQSRAKLEAQNKLVKTRKVCSHAPSVFFLIQNLQHTDSKNGNGKLNVETQEKERKKKNICET